MFYYPAPPVTISGVATEATLLLVEANTAQTVVELQTLNTTDFATESTLQDIRDNTGETVSQLEAVNTELSSQGSTLVDISSVLTNISVDYAKDTLQTDGNASLVNIDGQTSQIETNTGNIDLNITNEVASYPVEQLDVILLDTSSTNIPESSADPLEVVVSTNSNITRIVSVEDIGEFIAIYTGPMGSEELHGVLPLGGGELKVSMATGTRVSLRALENSPISTGKIAINFIGAP